MLKRIIFILIVLCTLRFYQLIFLSETAIKLVEWLGIGIIAVFTVFFLFYNREKTVRHRFLVPLVLIFISVIISMFASYAIHDQPFQATAYGQRVIYIYLAYFLFHQLKLEPKAIINSILALGVVYIGLYLVQFLIYPTLITSSTILVNRGTIRIFMPGLGFLTMSYFIWLYLIVKRPKFRYFIFLILALAVFVLSGTRQVIASMLLLTVIFILWSKIIKSKVLIITLGIVAVIPVYFLFQDIIFEMFEVSREQSQDVESNIRYQSAQYFLSDYVKKDIIYFTGNGANGKSMYGMKVLKIANQYGFYQADIGIIGDYSKFGLLFVIGVLIILIKVFSARLPENLMFIKYNYMGIVLTIVSGGGAFGSSGENILIHCILFYLIDRYSADHDVLGDFPEINATQPVAA